MAESIVESSTETILNVAKTGRIKVLLVDDDLTFLSIAKQCLEMQGEIEVDTASSVNEALEKLKKTDYDAVVSDYQMPGKDGLEFLKELRAKGNMIPFIVFTGKGREEIAVKALNCGANQYVDKHDDPETVYSELAHSIRKTVKEKHNEEQLLYQAQLMQNASDAIIASDENFILTSWNQAAERMYGWKENEVIGRLGQDVLQSEFVGIDCAHAIQMLRETGKFSGEVVQLHRDGHRINVETNAMVMAGKNNQIIGYVSVNRDITENQKLLEELKNANQRLNLLFESAPDAYYINDLKGKFIDGNKVAEEITGYTKNELIGKSFLRLKLLPRSQILKAVKLLAVNALGKATGPDELVLNRRDGTQVPVEIRTYPVKIKGQTLVLGIARDVSERKKLEEKLRVVGGLTRHDVRNKLSAVTGNAYLLRQKLAGDPKALEQLNDMEAAVQQMEQIFEFARTYEKLGVEQLTDMDVKKILDEAVSVFSDLKGVKIMNECHGLTVLADSLLRQLLYNLIDNSLKYGEKIRQIRVYYKTSSTDRLELVYEDDGVGIPGNMRSDLFKEGFTSGKGTGYGLFMIKRICEVYGWTIHETGKQGQGVRFTMTIPKLSKHGKKNYETS